MFESAELGHSITRQSYQRAVPGCAPACWTPSTTCEAGRSRAGAGQCMDGAGKGDTVNKLNECWTAATW